LLAAAVSSSICKESILCAALTDGNDPPFLILHGTADKTVPVAQSVELHRKLKAWGVSSRFVLIEGAPHTFDLQPAQRDLRLLIAGFFDEHLKHKAAADINTGRK